MVDEGGTVAGARALVERFFRALEARDWAGFADVLDPDVVYELPQSRERIMGRDMYVRFNAEYPGDWHLSPRVIVAEAGRAAVWFDWTIGDGEPGDAIVFFEIARGRMTRITDFWPEPNDPPPGREHLVERF